MTRALTVSVALAGLTLLAGPARAEINCNQVNKYLQTGRTPEDVADTMVIAIDEVKKCQAQAAAPAGGAKAPDAGAGAKGDAAKASEKK